MRVLVTGSRDWEDEGRVWDELDLCLQDAIENQVWMTVVHGDCPRGADRFARRWVMNARLPHLARAVDQERHPADWKHLDKAAGFARNADMVKLGADLVLAFSRVCSKPLCFYPLPHGSHGAAHTMGLAREAGIEVREFREGW